MILDGGSSSRRWKTYCLLDGKSIKNLDGVRTPGWVSLKANNKYRLMTFVLDGVSLMTIEKPFCSMANKINIDQWQKGEESYLTPKTDMLL